MYVGYGVPVRYGGVVKSTVVTAGSPITRGLLRDQVERGGPGTGRRADDPKLQHMFELSLGGLESVGSQSSRTCRNWWSGCLNVVQDIMLYRRVWSSDLRKFGELR